MDKKILINILDNFNVKYNFIYLSLLNLEIWYKVFFKDNYNIYQTFYFNPIEGKILVFPAHLNHLVQENKSNEDRISVSFNIRLNSGRMKRRGRVSIPRWNFNWSEYNESRI